MMTADDLPPFQAHSLTSRMAAEHVRGRARQDRQRVLAFIIARGLTLGATSDEVQRSLHLTHQTGSARVAELLQQGKIIESGRRRRTLTGCLADVLIEAPPNTPPREPRRRTQLEGFTHSQLARLSLELHTLYAGAQAQGAAPSPDVERLLRWFATHAVGTTLQEA